MSDQSIAEFTSVNPANFPAAQRALTLVASVSYWVFLAIFACLVLCVILAAAWAFSSIRKEISHTSRSKYIPGVTNRSPKKLKDPRSPRILFSLLLSLFYVTLTVTTYASETSEKKIDSWIKQLLVKYSFQLSPKICGLSPPQDSKMSLLSDGLAAVAIPDDDETYRFFIIKCERKYEPHPEIQRDLNKKNLKIESK